MVAEQLQGEAVFKPLPWAEQGAPHSWWLRKLRKCARKRGACMPPHHTYSHTRAKECIHVHVPMHHTAASRSFLVGQHSMC